MSYWSITDSPETPIWKPVGKIKSKWTIVTLPQNQIVDSGEATRSIGLDMDPGKYRIVVSQLVPTGEGSATVRKWRKDFYHDITPEQFDLLRNSPLRFTKGVMASEGLRYRCQLPGCDQEITSKLAAVVHEAEHSGVDLLMAPHTHPADIPAPKTDIEAAVAKSKEEAEETFRRLRSAAMAK